MLLCILVYVFSDNQQEDEDPGGGQPEFPEFNLILISFCLQFGFVNAIPTYLNNATFSEGLLADFMLRFYPEFSPPDVLVTSVSNPNSLNPRTKKPGFLTVPAILLMKVLAWSPYG